MKLTISGNPVSQKNEKKVAINRKTGRSFIVSSKNVQDWKKKAIQELQLQFRGLVITDYPIEVKLTFYYDNKRRHDLDNAAAGAMDALAQAGIIEDDNVSYVDRLSLSYGGLDKENPRTEIYIDD
jgi:Holliday junction resolvase RusA-like endonuclease